MAIDRTPQNWPTETYTRFPVDFENDTRYVREAQTMYYLKTGDFREFHELPTDVMKQLLHDAQALTGTRPAESEMEFERRMR